MWVDDHKSQNAAEYNLRIYTLCYMEQNDRSDSNMYTDSEAY
jgi:hypothetical protein